MSEEPFRAVLTGSRVWSLALKVAGKQMKLSHHECGVLSFDSLLVWLVLLLLFNLSRNARNLIHTETCLN